eukprot:11880159-Karenia_brevis.AAC.1
MSRLPPQLHGGPQSGRAQGPSWHPLHVDRLVSSGASGVLRCVWCPLVHLVPVVPVVPLVPLLPLVSSAAP